MNEIDEVSQYYYSLDTGQFYVYSQLRYLFPNVSIPRNKDLPELRMRILYKTPQPEPLEGHYAIMDAPEYRPQVYRYYQTWKQVPIDS